VAEETFATNESTKVSDQQTELEETKEEVIETKIINPSYLDKSDTNHTHDETL